MKGILRRFTRQLLLASAAMPIACFAATVLAQPAVPGSAPAARIIVAIPGSLLLPPYGSVTFSAGGPSADLLTSASLELDSDTPEPVTVSYTATAAPAADDSLPGLLTLTAPDGAAVQVVSGCQPETPPANTVSCAVSAMPFEGPASSPYLRSRVSFMTMAEGATLPPGSCPLPIPPYSGNPPPGPPGMPGAPVCDARYLGVSVAGFCKPPPPLPGPAAASSTQEGRVRAPGSACLVGSGSVNFYPSDVQFPIDDGGPADDSTPHLTVTGEGGLFTTVRYDEGLLISSPGGSVTAAADSGCFPAGPGFSVVVCPDVTLDPPSTVTFTVDTRSAQRPGTVTHAPGWNLVGGPPGTILLGNDGPLSTVDPDDPSAGYEQLPSRTPFEAGRGYWAYFDGTTQSPFPNPAPQASQTQLPPGQWTLIGNPLATQVTVSGADSVLIYDPVTAGYRQTATLYPGQGAWAYSAGGGTLTFTPAMP